MKKLKLLVLVIALFLLPAAATTSLARAEDAEEQTVEQIEQVEDETISAWFERVAMPLIIAGGGGALSLLLLATPYLRQLGTNKALSANNKALDVACKLLQSNVDEWKAKAEAANPDLDGLVDTLVEERIAPMFGKYENMLASILSSQQLAGEQLTAIRQAATHVWGENDHASAILAEQPSSAVLAEQALALELYKQKIAELMGVSASTICAEVDKQAANAVTVLVGGDDV